ncbi:Nif11-like leader peptide family natural product precursor [Labrys neptuniae]
MTGADLPFAQLERFRTAVLDDTALQAKLEAIEDHEAFIALVLEMGQAGGFHFGEDDIRLAMQATRRLFLARLMVSS